MSVKVYIDTTTNEIVKYEPSPYKEVVVDYDINDTIVVDEKSWEIVKIQDSTQWQSRIEELKTKKELTEIEEHELIFLTGK